MQLCRSHRDNDRTAEKYQREIQRQNLIIQRQQQYLVASPVCQAQDPASSQQQPLPLDNEPLTNGEVHGDVHGELDHHNMNDNIETELLPAIVAIVGTPQTERERANTLVNGIDNHVESESVQHLESKPVQHLESEQCQHSELVSSTKAQHDDIEHKLQCLLEKVPEGGQYVEHMKKLQVRAFFYFSLTKNQVNPQIRPFFLGPSSFCSYQLIKILI